MFGFAVLAFVGCGGTGEPTTDTKGKCNTGKCDTGKAAKKAEGTKEVTGKWGTGKCGSK